jgi:hypothetical protein
MAYSRINRMTIKVAIRAFLNAPRQMNIERERRQALQLQEAWTHVVLRIFHEMSAAL